MNDEQELCSYLDLHKQTLARELAEKKLQLNYLRWFEDQAAAVNYSVAIKSMPSYDVMSYRTTVKNYNQEESLWQKLFEELLPQHHKELGPSLASFHEETAELFQIEVMVGIPKRLKAAYPLTQRFTAGLVATTVISGAYSAMPALHLHMRQWLELNHYVQAGPIFNIYHASPATAEKEADYITEVCYPIQQKSVENGWDKTIK